MQTGLAEQAAANRQNGLMPLLGHAQLPHLRGAADQPKHGRASTEDELSHISRGHIALKWGCSESVDG